MAKAKNDSRVGKESGNAEVKSKLDNAEFALETAFPSPENAFAPYHAAASSNADVIVAIDTSTLLLPYSVRKDDLTALAKVYEALAAQDRLFIPARSAREFIRHRDRKLADMIQGLNAKISRINIPDKNLSPLLEGVAGYDALANAANKLKTAHSEYISAHADIIKTIKAWRGDDPVTSVYRKVFTPPRIIEHEDAFDDVLSEWKARREAKVPPGYKDAAKEDSGIGDFLIWKSVLRLGASHKKDLVFVTGEEKADWFVRSEGEAIYPRPELIDEYRRASDGHHIRLSSLHELLSAMKVAPSVVNEVRDAESRAGIASRATTVAGVSAIDIGFPEDAGTVAFDYSTNDGAVEVGLPGRRIRVRFSKASDKAIHLYRDRGTVRIARVKQLPKNAPITLDQQDTSSSSYTIALGEGFLAQNGSGDVLVGRLLEIKDDSRGAEQDLVRFSYCVYAAGVPVFAP